MSHFVRSYPFLISPKPIRKDSDPPEVKLLSHPSASPSNTSVDSRNHDPVRDLIFHKAVIDVEIKIELLINVRQLVLIF